MKNILIGMLLSIGMFSMSVNEGRHFPGIYHVYILKLFIRIGFDSVGLAKI